jgi:hypothetical protein
LPTEEKLGLEGMPRLRVTDFFAETVGCDGVVGTDEVLDAQSLPKVKMPNPDGFIPFPHDPK